MVTFWKPEIYSRKIKKVLDKLPGICYTIIRKRQEDKKIELEMMIVAGASFEDLLREAGITVEEWEEG